MEIDIYNIRNERQKINNENLIIGNHIEIQQYFIDKYNHD